MNDKLLLWAQFLIGTVALSLVGSCANREYQQRQLDQSDMKIVYDLLPSFTTGTWQDKHVKAEFLSKVVASKNTQARWAAYASICKDRAEQAQKLEEAVATLEKLKQEKHKIEEELLSLKDKPHEDVVQEDKEKIQKLESKATSIEAEVKSFKETNKAQLTELERLKSDSDALNQLLPVPLPSTTETLESLVYKLEDGVTKDERLSAIQSLANDWRFEPRLVPMLIEATLGKIQYQSKDGLWNKRLLNTLDVLARLPIEVLQPHTAALTKLLDEVDRNCGEISKAMAARVRLLLRAEASTQAPEEDKTAPKNVAKDS